MPLQVGGQTVHGFHEPLGLLGDRHRRLEVLVAVERRGLSV
jgi:hypothetical protein